MKPLRIDFVAQQNWRWIWSAFAVLLLGLLAWTCWKWGQLKSESSITQQSLAQLRTQLKTSNQKPTALSEPRGNNLQQVSDLLQRNLNSAFATAENMKEPGTKLKSFSYDAVANTLRLDYELDSMVRTSSVTAVLNAGYDTRPWNLDTVTTINTNQANTSASANSARASWTGKIADF